MTRTYTKPEDYRPLRIKLGTKIGLIGDYNEPSTWSRDELVIATLKAYLIVERRLLFGQGVAWDTAALVSLLHPLETITQDAEQHVVNMLLLMHRYAMTQVEGHVFQEKFFPPWEGDCAVLVYGVRDHEVLGEGPLSLEVWQPKTVYLSAAADLTLEETPSPSARILQKIKELSAFKKMLDTGSITEEEFATRQANIQAEITQAQAEWHPPTYKGVA